MREAMHRLFSPNHVATKGGLPVENVQHQRLQRVGGQQAVVRAQHAALVVRPGLDQQDAGLEQAAAADGGANLRAARSNIGTIRCSKTHGQH